jgi:hypothetical protein
MQKRYRQGETEANTKGGTEEAKGGAKMTREDVVQAALTVERWCKTTRKEGIPCQGKCPLWGCGCVLGSPLSGYPEHWGLDDFLRTRGLERGQV